MKYMMMTAAMALMLAGCGRGVSHGPVAPTTNVNPETGSTGSGGGK